MRFYITGGTGYIGSSIAKRLIEDDHKVAILKREHSDLSYLSEIEEQISFFNYSGTYRSVDESVGHFKPDMALHFASYYTFDHTPDDLDTLIDSNIRLGLYLAEALVQHQVQYLINTGTSFEHFTNCDYRPVNLYAATKQAFQNLLEYYSDSNKISAITLKLFDTYGPRDKRGKLIELLKKSIKTKQEINLSGGEQLLDFVHIDDVVEAFLVSVRLIQSREAGFKQEYGISSDETLSLKKLVSLIEEIRGEALNVNFGVRPYREREVMVPWSDFEPLDGWKPVIGLREGLKAILN
ncbi:MAG: NAD(P)-dependent oxidoreductase [Balneolaceae bacterium]|nr:NAD(P)-dependent oxidoreductase [Balneolaceae bacterium]